MKMCVLMAHVPDTASAVKVGPGGDRIDETGLKWIVSPYDEFALEEALKLKEAHAGSVTVVAFGPERVAAGLRECLARGADTAAHVSGGDEVFGDALAIARVLAAAVERLGPFDLIFTGVKGVGSDNSLVPAMVAEFLDLPHVSGVVKLDVGGDGLTAQREIEGGYEVVASPLPCVLAAHKGLNEPRYPSLKGIMAAKRVQIQTLSPAELGLDESGLAGNGARCRWRSLVLPPAKAGGAILDGQSDPVGAAKELVRLLREQAKAV